MNLATLFCAQLQPPMQGLRGAFVARNALHEEQHDPGQGESLEPCRA